MRYNDPSGEVMLPGGYNYTNVNTNVNTNYNYNQWQQESAPTIAPLWIGNEYADIIGSMEELLYATGVGVSNEQQYMATQMHSPPSFVVETGPLTMIGVEIDGEIFYTADVIEQKVRPDLGFVGNQIRDRAGSEFSQDMFENYWLGNGDVNLSSARFNDILTHQGTVSATSNITLSNGQPGIKKVHSFYNSNEYGLALGRATIFYTSSGVPVGLIDTYDFDPKTWGVRSYDAEIKTRAVNVAASIYGINARGFKIRYGLQAK